MGNGLGRQATHESRLRSFVCFDQVEERTTARDMRPPFAGLEEGGIGHPKKEGVPVGQQGNGQWGYQEMTELSGLRS